MAEIDIERQEGDDRSLGELFSDLSKEITALVSQEMDLLKTEMSAKLSRMGKDAGMIAAGGLLAYAGFLVLLAALTAALALVMPLWAAALIVGAVVTGIGGYLAYHGLQALKKEDLVPHETLETLKEDKQWARQQTRQRG